MSDRQTEIDALLPLPTVTFHVLLALADRDRHGYAILREIGDRTGGEVRIGAGTLYRSLHRMLEQGLVVETDERPVPEQDDERRRYYRITPAGSRALASEAERLASLAERARERVAVRE